MNANRLILIAQIKIIAQNFEISFIKDVNQWNIAQKLIRYVVIPNEQTSWVTTVLWNPTIYSLQIKSFERFSVLLIYCSILCSLISIKL